MRVCSTRGHLWIGRSICRHDRTEFRRIIWSSDHLVIWSSDHLIIWSSDHLTIWSSDHPIIRSSDHLIIWSSDHLIIWSSDHLTIWSVPIDFTADSSIHWSTSFVVCMHPHGTHCLIGSPQLLWISNEVWKQRCFVNRTCLLCTAISELLPVWTEFNSRVFVAPASEW